MKNEKDNHKLAEALGNVIFRIEINANYISRHITDDNGDSIAALNAIRRDIESLKILKGLLS